MADKKAYFKFITPAAPAIYPKLHKADTKWKAEGEYSVKQAFDADATGFLVGKETIDLPTLIERLQVILDEYFKETKATLIANKKGAKAKALTKRDVFAAATDAEGNENGKLLIKAHMKASGVSKKDGKPWTRQPLVFDAKRKKLSPVPAIFGGSELKVAVEAAGYYAPNDNVVGITLYIDAVQVIKLVKGGDRSAESYGFGEEEGFADDTADEGGEQFDDSDATPADVAAGDDGAPAAGDEF